MITLESAYIHSQFLSVVLKTGLELQQVKVNLENVNMLVILNDEFSTHIISLK